MARRSTGSLVFILEFYVAQRRRRRAEDQQSYLRTPEIVDPQKLQRGRECVDRIAAVAAAAAGEALPL